MRVIASVLALGLLTCVSTFALAQGASAVFTSFDFPGSNATSPGAITPDGKIVGDYVGPDGNQHGFLLSDETFQTIDFPGSTRTTVRWIRGGDLLAIDELLQRLAAIDPQQTRIVELRFFAGLSVEETAHALSISDLTVKRDWAMAKAWLQRELQRANRGE